MDAVATALQGFRNFDYRFEIRSRGSQREPAIETPWRLETWRSSGWTTWESSSKTSEATIDFFCELGLELEGRTTIEGEWAGRVTGLGDQSVEIAMMRTPDGHSRLELSHFLTPPVVADHRNAPVNALGYLRVMFAVDDVDETLKRLCARGRSS